MSGKKIEKGKKGFIVLPVSMGEHKLSASKKVFSVRCYFKLIFMLFNEQIRCKVSENQLAKFLLADFFC